jgi:hypothetical protein
VSRAAEGAGPAKIAEALDLRGDLRELIRGIGVRRVERELAKLGNLVGLRDTAKLDDEHLDGLADLLAHAVDHGLGRLAHAPESVMADAATNL